MIRFLVRISVASALLAIISTVTYAGNVLTHDDHAVDQATCGSIWMNQISHDELLANTAKHDPALYQRIIADSKPEQHRRVFRQAADVEWTFFVTNRVTQQYEEVAATLVWEGKGARIWVDNVDLANATAKQRINNVLPALQRALDTATGAKSRNPNKGILDNDVEVFGPVPSKYAADWDYKTNFLFTDIKDALTGGFVGGYFSPGDQGEKPSSNRMNLLYIDSKEGVQSGINALASTIAHEFQHLIHNQSNPNSETVFNEGCSEEASILCGYQDRTNPNFLNKPNVPFMRWSYDDAIGSLLLADYERAMTFMHYMREQFGEAFLTEFSKTKTTGMSRVNDALVSIGNQTGWKDVMKAFALANYLQVYAPDSRYAYKNRLSTSAAKAAQTYSGTTFPSSITVPLESFGASYMVFNNPGAALTFRLNSGRDYVVKPIYYQGSQIDIGDDMLPDNDYTIGQWHNLTKVVLVFTSLSTIQQSINVLMGVSGVDEPNAPATLLALLGTTPNPVTESSMIHFSTARTGSVRMNIYAADGTIVRTLIDGEQIEAGRHDITFDSSDLPNGFYIARLSQGDQTASSPIMIVR